MLWPRRIGFLAAVVVIMGLTTSCQTSTGDDEAPEALAASSSTTVTTTTTAPRRYPTPIPRPVEDPRLACVRALPPRQQLGQLLAISVNGRAADLDAGRIADLGIGTVLLQHLGGEGPAERIQALKDASVIPPLVAVDEEGGAVQDLRDVLGPLPSAARMVATTDPDGAREEVLAHARAMADLGIDVVFAPVVDVLPADGSDPLGDDRTFSADPAVVTEYGQAYVDAFLDAGILPTLKHFPGHGAATGDSHDGVVVAPPLPELQERDLLPYDTLLDDDVAVMVGHMVVPDVSYFGPSSLSSGIITDLLRTDYGFDGLVVTDSLSMGAVTGQGPPEAVAFEALRAGADVALFASLADPDAVLARLVRGLAAGNLDADQIAASVARVLEVKDIDPCSL